MSAQPTVTLATWTAGMVQQLTKEGACKKNVYHVVKQAKQKLNGNAVCTQSCKGQRDVYNR